MKQNALIQRVANVLNSTSDVTKVLVLGTNCEDVIKLQYAADDNILYVYFMEDNGEWEHCMTIPRADLRRYKYIAQLLMANGE